MVFKYVNETKNTEINYAKHDIIFEQETFGNILKKFIRFSMNQYLSRYFWEWISIIDIKYYFKYQGHRKNVKC